MIRTLKTKPQEQNEAEIDLAANTMQLLGKFHAQSHLKHNADLRSLLACLCDWQDRWATPILNPMTGKPDFEGPLETPRPLDLLIAHKYLVPCESEAKGSSDIVSHNKQLYCYAGKSTWSALVKAGKITGADAEPPKLTAFCWLKDFFQLLAESPLTSEEKGEIRPLAACWYYSATECNFDESEEAPVEDASALQLPPGLMNMLMAGAGMQHMLAGAAGDEDEEEDEDFDPEGDEEEEQEEEDTPPNSLFLRMKAKAKPKQEEEEEEEEEEEHSPPKSLYMRMKAKSKSGGSGTAGGHGGGPQKKSKASPGKKVSFSAPDREEEEGEEEVDEEEEEEEEEEEDEEGADEIEPLARPPETAQVKEIREAIVKSVGELHAYIPVPATHMLYFKRMLVRMQRDTESQLWFPWGQPPIQHLVKVHEAADKDSALKRYSADILKLVAPQVLKQ